MKRPLFIPVTSAFVAAVVGCGGGGSSPDAAGADTAVPEAATPPPPYCTSQPPVSTVTDLTGTWVVRMVGGQIVSAPTLVPFHIQSVFYLLYDIRQDGSSVSINGRYCDRTEVDPPGALVPVIIPAAWAHTEKAVQRSGSFAAVADAFPVLTLGPSIEIAGAKLASLSDPLPTEPTDPRVFDEDGDGNPGLTVILNGTAFSGSVFSVQRQTTVVKAIVVAPDRIEGELNFVSEQKVLASVPASIADLYKLAQTVSDPTACSSTFAMVKVAEAQPLDGGAVDAGQADGGGLAPVTCAWVRARELTLFPQ
jgi:hypothetical protein